MGKGQGCALSKPGEVKYEVRHAQSLLTNSSAASRHPQRDHHHHQEEEEEAGVGNRSVQVSGASVPPPPLPVPSPSSSLTNALPPGWMSTQDPSTGRTYYSNAATGKSQWEDPRPHHQQGPMAGSAFLQDPRLMPLQPNWEQRIDPATGRVYFVNLTSNFVTWDDPRLQLPPTSAAQAGGAAGQPGIGGGAVMAYPAPVVQPGYGYYHTNAGGTGPCSTSSGGGGGGAGMAAGYYYQQEQQQQQQPQPDPHLFGPNSNNRRRPKRHKSRWGAYGYYGGGYHRPHYYDHSSSSTPYYAYPSSYSSGSSSDEGSGAADGHSSSTSSSGGVSDNDDHGGGGGGDDTVVGYTAVAAAGGVVGGDADDDDVVAMYGGAGPRDLPDGDDDDDGGGSWARCVFAGFRSRAQRKRACHHRHQYGSAASRHRAARKRACQEVVAEAGRRAKRAWLYGVVWGMAGVLRASMLVWPRQSCAIARAATLCLATHGCPAALRAPLHTLLRLRLAPPPAAAAAARRTAAASTTKHKQMKKKNSYDGDGPAWALVQLVLGLYLALEYLILHSLHHAFDIFSALYWQFLASYYAYIHRHPAARLTVLPQQFRSTIAPRTREITIVTQASVDRLAAVEAMARAWDGAMTVALFLPDPALARQHALLRLVAAMHSRVDARARCRLHILLATTTTTTLDDAASFLGPHHSSSSSSSLGNHSTSTTTASTALPLYPVNALRNLALEHAQTELVFLLDADFVPSHGLHSALVENAEVYEELERRAAVERHVFVVPAFEILEQDRLSPASRYPAPPPHGTSTHPACHEDDDGEDEDEDGAEHGQHGESEKSMTAPRTSAVIASSNGIMVQQQQQQQWHRGGGGRWECAAGAGEGEGSGEEVAAPGSMDDLVEAWRAGLVAPFHCAHFPQGHSPTDYSRFLRCSMPSSSSSSSTHTPPLPPPYPIHYRLHYEPYMIAAKSVVPRYDPRFRGYGLNKIAHVYECAVRGMSFYVVPQHFVTALPHPRSPAWHYTYGVRKDPVQQLRIRGLFRQFKAELHTAVGPLRPTPQPASCSIMEPSSTPSDVIVIINNGKDLEAGGGDRDGTEDGVHARMVHPQHLRPPV